MRNLVAIAFLVVSQPVAAARDAGIVSALSTQDLIVRCRKASDPMRVDCSSYLLGIYDQMSFSGLICPPDNSTGGGLQAVAVALKFLNEHPEKWHFHPVALVGESFKAAFPCGTK